MLLEYLTKSRLWHLVKYFWAEYIKMDGEDLTIVHELLPFQFSFLLKSQSKYSVLLVNTYVYCHIQIDMLVILGAA